MHCSVVAAVVVLSSSSRQSIEESGARGEELAVMSYQDARRVGNVGSWRSYLK